MLPNNPAVAGRGGFAPWLLVGRLLVALLLFLACGQALATQEVFGVSNGHLEIGLGHEHGDLTRLTDAHASQNFAGTASSGAGLWELTLLPTEKTLSPADAKSFDCQSLSGRQPALRLTWDQFGLSAAPALRVEVVVRLEPGQPMSRWELGVTGLGKLGIRQVRFPRIVNIPRQEHERVEGPVRMREETSA